MVNWLKWKFVWTVIYLAITYVSVKNWIKDKGFYSFIWLCQMYVVADFTIGCCILPSKYNPRYIYNFYYLCIYLVFMVALYIMLGKLLTSLRKEK
jgi:hypothetical protein